MASSTLYHFQIEVSDVDRGLYRTLDLRVARHPSETLRFLLTRVMAYCLCYEEGLAFSKGLSTTDEPALWVRDPAGRPTLWIEVGTPSNERLHKASKACARVRVFTHQDPGLLRKAARAKPIHKAESIEVCALPASFLDALEAITTMRTRLTLVHTDGMLYVSDAAAQLSTPLERYPLG